jgi:transposase
MGRRRIFTKEFKESAIEHYHSSGKSAKEVSIELGLEGSTVGRWLRESREAEAKDIKAFPGQGIPRDEEIANLRKKVSEQQEIIEILKKATAIFATKKTL